MDGSSKKDNTPRLLQVSFRVFHLAFVISRFSHIVRLFC